MHALDDVTAVVEDAADVLSVHGAGEVGVAVVAPVSTSSADSLQAEELQTGPTYQKLVANEVLGPGHAWVLSGLGSPSELWKVVLNLRFSSEDFLSKQVLLVEEQDHRDGPAGRPHIPVVPDALEEVQSLLQAVGLVVLPNDHVVAAAGHHEDDGSHVIEALDPLAAFIALAAHIEHGSTTIHLLEVDFVHLELGLKDSRGQDAAAKQVLEQKEARPDAHIYLVAWHIVGLLDHVNLVQEAWKKRGHGGQQIGYLLLGTVNQLVLIGALIAGTNSLVLPQSLGVLIEFLKKNPGKRWWEVKVGHVHHAQNVVNSELILRVGQLHRGHQVAHGGHDGTYFNGLLQVVFDVLHFGGLLTTVELKRKKKSYCILPIGDLGPCSWLPKGRGSGGGWAPGGRCMFDKGGQTLRM
ncbi:Gm20721 [Phodopus roborovskii]|uniref:Gm20721 protein n=1 Tax=Phodopus roborovskii TaxID=109678 RepID=A0AAU9YPU3_PHORO|nr:Gm20721 [Phodopus roborovskii]